MGACSHGVTWQGARQGGHYVAHSRPDCFAADAPTRAFTQEGLIGVTTRFEAAARQADTVGYTETLRVSTVSKLTETANRSLTRSTKSPTSYGRADAARLAVRLWLLRNGISCPTG